MVNEEPLPSFAGDLQNPRYALSECACRMDWLWGMIDMVSYVSTLRLRTTATVALSSDSHTTGLTLGDGPTSSRRYDRLAVDLTFHETKIYTRLTQK